VAGACLFLTGLVSAAGCVAACRPAIGVADWEACVAPGAPEAFCGRFCASSRSGSPNVCSARGKGVDCVVGKAGVRGEIEARTEGPAGCGVPLMSPPCTAAAGLGWRELIGVTWAADAPAGAEAPGEAGVEWGAAGRCGGRGVTAADRPGAAETGAVVFDPDDAVDAEDGGGADDTEAGCADAASSRLRMLEGWRYRLDGDGMVSCPRVDWIRCSSRGDGSTGGSRSVSSSRLFSQSSAISTARSSLLSNWWALAMSCRSSRPSVYSATRILWLLGELLLMPDAAPEAGSGPLAHGS